MYPPKKRQKVMQPLRANIIDRLDRKKILENANYYFKDGNRYVRPYYFEYIAFAKGRWIGRKILEIFSTEFLAYSQEYYLNAILNGRICVNGQKVSLDYYIKGHDRITHLVHRHEPPVPQCHIEIIGETTEVLAVIKPSLLPIHPCGRYRYNTLLLILEKELGSVFYSFHRLDSSVSGVLVLAKSKGYAAKYSKMISKGSVRKYYLARVKGKFPDCNKSEENITIDRPILCVDLKRGIYAVDSNGKASITLVRRLSYNGMTSVVLCSPLTGRTHQIRVHLASMGHPIVNDTLYNQELYQKNDLSSKLTYTDITPIYIPNIDSKISSCSSKNSTSTSNDSDNLNTDSNVNIDSFCPYCVDNTKNSNYVKNQLSNQILSDLKIKGSSSLQLENPQNLHINTGIWLFAVQYETQQWCFKAPWPKWAHVDFSN